MAQVGGRNNFTTARPQAIKLKAVTTAERKRLRIPSYQYFTSVNRHPEYYDPTFIMRSKDQSSLRIIDLWTFKSLKTNKRYIVEVEGFENEFYGLKFYWKGVEKSKDRYSLLTNDYEPRTIVRSCIEVMLQYFRKNPGQRNRESTSVPVNR